MAFTITHDSSRGLATVTFNGAITPADLWSSAAEAIALQKARGIWRFLVDSPDWNLTATIIDLYDLPTREYTKADLDRRSRIAIVQPNNEKALEGARFYENACRNRGWNARVHPDRKSALEWLEAG